MVKLGRLNVSSSHAMTYEELRDLDVRQGKASMDWYRAAQALYRGEISREDVDGLADMVLWCPV